MIIAIIIIVAAGSFCAGMKYNQSKNPAAGQNFGNFANLSPEERQARMQQFGANASGNARMMRSDGEFAAGEILSKDEKSMTIKLQDGGSKIIFFSESTPIIKTASGTPQDLTTGQSVIVNGTANQDGSITAQSVQLRPEMSTR